MQCLTRVELHDAVMSWRCVTTYSYHHGFFDPHEREFRGFGRVDRRDAETISDPDPGSPGGTAIAPVLTRSWFHTGAWERRLDLETAFAQEWWSGDPDAKWPGLSGPGAMPSDAASRKEIFRALRGKPLCEEVFSEDGDVHEDRPYTVTRQRWVVRTIQAPEDGRHGIFDVVPSETVARHYEQTLDPRTVQTLALEVDDFGVLRKEASVAYPRRSPEHDAQGGLVAPRIVRKAVARGLVEVDDEGVMTVVRPEVQDEEKQQELALLQAAAARPRSGGTGKEEFPRRRRYHARSSGFDLDAAVRIAASDRTGLERLSRYLLRGPVASDRLAMLPDGRFELTLKRPWRDGTTSFVWTGEELVAKLAALVAPFRQKLVRYHGILAPNHPQREAVVSKVRARKRRRRRERMPWAELLKRVWGTEALRCSKCGGWRTICASITDGMVARKILLWAGIDPDLPRFEPLRC